MSKYQVIIANLHNIPFRNVKKLVPNFLIDKEKKCVLISKNFARIEVKKLYCVSEFNQSQRLKPYVGFSTQKSIEARKKNGHKDGKTLYKLMNNAVCSKRMESLRNELI